MVDRRSIAVFGAGAVGSYLGGKLASIPESVRPRLTLVGRPRIVAALREKGLVIQEEGPQSTVYPQSVTSVTGMPPVDLVVLTVRSYDVEAALEDVLQLMGEYGVLVAFQNGVGSDEVIAGRIDPRRVVAGTLTARVDMERPGVVARRTSSGGLAMAGLESSVPAWTIGMFSSTGLDVLDVLDASSLRWSKLLLNMVGAATTAILDIDMAAAVNNPKLFRIEQLAFREATRVMQKKGIRTTKLPDYHAEHLRLVMRMPRQVAQRILAPRLASARGGKAPNMRADLIRGRTEVEALHGAVVARASQIGVHAPVNRALAQLIDELSRYPQRRRGFHHDPDALISYLEGAGISL